MPRSSSFNASRTEPTALPELSTSAGAMPKRRGTPRKESAPKNHEETYKPQSEPKATNLDESSFGKRLSRRKGISKAPVLNENASRFPSSDDENSDDSDPSGFRESRRVLPNLRQIWVAKTKDTAPKSAPLRFPFPSPCLSPLQDTYVNVWFGPNHPLNVSRPSDGRQTNNSAEIEAATVAAQQAHEVGINKLKIKTDSKLLVNSATGLIPRWEANDWKTYENKPIRNRSKFEKMKTALEPLDVILEHFPSHKGIPGNEMADKFAREGIEVLPSTKNKGGEIPPEQMIVDILPQPPDSEGSDETDEDISKQHQPKNKLREDLQKFSSRLD